MEDALNGKLEESLEVEGDDGGKDSVLKEDLEDPKPELESVKEIIVDERNSEPVNDADHSISRESSSDEEDKTGDKSPQVENSENHQVVAEKVVPLSENDGVSHVVTDAAENGFKEKPGLSSDETIAVSAVVADEEIKLQSSNDTVAVDLVSQGMGEATLGKNNEVPHAPVDVVVSKGVKETEIPILNESIGESSVSHDLESKEIGDKSLQVSEDALVIENRDIRQEENKPEIPEGTGNPPLISLARHPLQRSSWRSCCGLFEVLRRHSER